VSPLPCHVDGGGSCSRRRLVSAPDERIPVPIDETAPANTLNERMAMTRRGDAVSRSGAGDNALLRKLAAGDTAALGDLYDRHATALYRWLLAKGLPRGDADDLLSECFLALVDRGEGAARIADVRAYLFAIARNRLAHRTPEAQALELVPEPATDQQSSDAVAVREALADLPPEQCEVVVLKVWHGHTFAEIGALLGIPPNTASSRYRYALEKLRAILGESDDG